MKIRSLEPKYRYDLIFRYTIKNFPKNLTFNKYEANLRKKLKISSKNGNSYNERGRRSFRLHWITEREKRRICKIAKSIDDGILREVIVSSKIDYYD